MVTSAYSLHSLSKKYLSKWLMYQDLSSILWTLNQAEHYLGINEKTFLFTFPARLDSEYRVPVGPSLSEESVIHHTNVDLICMVKYGPTLSNWSMRDSENNRWCMRTRIDRVRNAAGKSQFPWVYTPSYTDFLEGNTRCGIDMRQVLEMREAVGRVVVPSHQDDEKRFSWSKSRHNEGSWVYSVTEIGDPSNGLYAYYDFTKSGSRNHLEGRLQHQHTAQYYGGGNWNIHDWWIGDESDYSDIPESLAETTSEGMYVFVIDKGPGSSSSITNDVLEGLSSSWSDTHLGTPSNTNPQMNASGSWYTADYGHVNYSVLIDSYGDRGDGSGTQTTVILDVSGVESPGTSQPDIHTVTDFHYRSTDGFPFATPSEFDPVTYGVSGTSQRFVWLVPHIVENSCEALSIVNSKMSEWGTFIESKMKWSEIANKVDYGSNTANWYDTGSFELDGWSEDKSHSVLNSSFPLDADNEVIWRAFDAPYIPAGWPDYEPLINRS